VALLQLRRTATTVGKQFLATSLPMAGMERKIQFLLLVAHLEAEPAVFQLSVFGVALLAELPVPHPPVVRELAVEAETQTQQPTLPDTQGAMEHTPEVGAEAQEAQV
jgi:hypothetical protein